MKFAITLSAAFLSASAVFSAETLLEIKGPADVEGMGKSTTFANGVFSSQKSFYILSRKSPEIDVNKTYKISGFFRTKPGVTAPTRFYFGVAPRTAKNQPILPFCIAVMPGTDTSLVAAAKKGDSSVKVKDAAKWDTKVTYRTIAFNTKSDRSDLPNFDAANFITSIEKQPDGYLVKLKKPLTKDYPAGTAVRQHTSGNSYLYAASTANKDTAADWTEFSGKITGPAQSKLVNNQWWIGAEKASLILFPNKPSAGIEFKDLKLEAL